MHKAQPMIEEPLSLDHTVIAQRAANEGVPIAAISRIIQKPFADVSQTLQEALQLGRVGSLPKPDWPPSTRWVERIPCVPRSMNVDDMEFHCKRVFKLTNLEVGFMTVLLRHEFTTKERLHVVIESQRFKRYQRPNDQSVTDPKMVDVIVCKLRKKLKLVNDAIVLTTSWGKGYFFEPAVKDKVFTLIGGSYGCGPEAGRGADTDDAE